MDGDDVAGDGLPYRTLARERPASTALLGVGPVVLAAVQLGIGLGTELPVGYAAGFAAVMLAYAVLATGYNRSAHRRRLLEG